MNGNWNFAYDDFNRLCMSNQGGQSSLNCGTSSNNTGTQAYKYVFDRFGNRWQQNVTAGSGNMSSLGFDANNRITSGSGVTYDAAGNVTNDGTHAYAFDAENRITQVDAGSTAVYVYNASGDRIRKTTASGSVDYLYDLGGHSITELSSSGGWNRGEVYAGGKHLATYSGGTSGTTYFIHADWLGTERARSTSFGAGCETTVSLPFGDGQVTNSTCTPPDPSPMHFTGKQRDTETGNDDFGARYFNSNMARWLTPDWSARPEGVPYAVLTNPQSLNLYAYIQNNPTSSVDVDGHADRVSYNNRGGGGAMPDTVADVAVSVADPEAGLGGIVNLSALAALSASSTAAPDPQAQPASGEGSQANLDKRNAIAANAEEAYQRAAYTQQSPYGPEQCSTAVADWTSKAGAKVQFTPDGGPPRPPVAGELANPTAPISNTRVLGPNEKPAPGDYAAISLPHPRPGATGDSAVVVRGPHGLTTVHAGEHGLRHDPHFIKGNSTGTYPGVVYRRYTGD